MFPLKHSNLTQFGTGTFVTLKLALLTRSLAVAVISDRTVVLHTIG